MQFQCVNFFGLKIRPCKTFDKSFVYGYIGKEKAHVVPKLQFCALSLSRPQQLECCLLCCDFCSYFQSTSEPKLFFYQEVKFSTDNFDEDGKRILITSSPRNICVHIVQPDGTLAFEQTNYFSTKTLSIQMLLKLDRPIQGYFLPPQYLSWPV